MAHHSAITRDLAPRPRAQRIAGMERRTAVLVATTCLVFAVGIALLTQSIVSAVLAAVVIALGVAAALRMLLPPRYARDTSSRGRLNAGLDSESGGPDLTPAAERLANPRELGSDRAL